VRKGIAQKLFLLIIMLLKCSTPFSLGGKAGDWGIFLN
jgi:hypothetical protein